MSTIKTVASIAVMVSAATLFYFQPSALAQAALLARPSTPDQIQGATKLYDIEAR